MNINSIKHLAFILKCKATDAELINISEALCDKDYKYDSQFYRERKEVSRLKNEKLKTRVLNPSLGRLKLIQTRIKKNILDKINFPNYIQGGIKGSSNISNARLHLGNKYKFTSDIKGFFPSITPKHVYNAFCSLGIHPEVSRILTILTTYKGRLPQGTPTSSHIANLVFISIDEKINAFCKSKGIFYTRYIDDITLSSKNDFQLHLSEIVSFIQDSEFNISNRKTQYRHIIDITGISTGNNMLKPNAKFYVKLELDNNETSREARLKYLDRVKSAHLKKK